MNRTKIQLIVTLLLFNAIGVFAQGGSNYSIFGLGDIYYSTNSATVGLGGTTIAFPSNHSLNPLNPAIWSTITNTRLQVGYIFNQHVNTIDDYTLMQNNGKVNGIQALFAVDTSIGMSIGLGFVPYTMVNYLVNSPTEIVLDGTTYKGEYLNQGKGGLSRGYLGASIRPWRNLAIGAQAFATFGLISNGIVTQFYDYYSYLSQKIIEDEIDGYGTRLGMTFMPFEGFTLGAFWEYNSALNLKTTVIRATSFSNNDTSVSSSTISMPALFGAGFSYQTGKFIFGADFMYQDFSSLKFRGGIDTSFRPLASFSIGLSRLGNPSFNASFLDRIKYNFGGGYRQQYYSVFGTPINEYYGSFGIEIPIVGTVYLDGAITVGVRGENSNGLMREMFGRLSIDLSIGETWFKPFLREY
jgi:hypothetical protein